MEPKLIIYDMGNTLLDFHAGKHTDEDKDIIGCQNMSDYFKEHHHLNVSSETIHSELIKKWYADFYIRKQLIELDVCVYVNQFLKTIGLENNQVDCKQLMKAFYKPYMDEVVVNKGAYESLKQVKKHMKVGVISNCILFDEIYVETFERTGLAPYIDKFIFSYSRQIRKPDKRLFKEMLAHFDCRPQAAIMVGDNYKADITPAHELGMRTIHYTKTPIEDSVADQSISDLDMVPSVLEGI